MDRIAAPVYCKSCAINTDESHWYWMNDARYSAGGKWRCRQQKRESGRRYIKKLKSDPKRYEARKQWAKEHASKNREYSRYKAYVSWDKRNGFITIPWKDAKALMHAECHYCGVAACGGLDRMDSSIGHSEGNVVSCCMTCNGILSDLPYAAKELIGIGLRRAREAGTLDGWIIPQLRHLK